MRSEKHQKFLIKEFKKKYPNKEIKTMADLNRVLLDEEIKALAKEYVQERKGKENYE